jgi:hypothetical protein
MTAASAEPSLAHETRPPPLADDHISKRPQRLQHAQARTYRPKSRVMACAPLTAISPADAPNENSRSRRLGTWKECRTNTATKRMVSGSSTVVMPTAGARTACTNHTDAAIAPAAMTTFMKPGGRDRVTKEKTIPTETRISAPSAVVCDTSPMAAQASMATPTVPRQATRSGIESSGGPGRLARRMASSALTSIGGRRPGSPER